MTTTKLSAEAVAAIREWVDARSDGIGLTTERHVRALLADREVLEQELADVKGPQFEKRCDQIKANFEAKVTALEAELKEARESLAAEHALGVMRNAMRESAEQECKGKQQVINELLVSLKKCEDANTNLQRQLGKGK